MNLMNATLAEVESVDRRVLGAIRFTDIVTGLPVSGDVKVTVLGATLISKNGVEDLGDSAHLVSIIQNRSGLSVLQNAPYFNNYIYQFYAPDIPDEIKGSLVRLHMAVVPYSGYLPMEFSFDLPRNDSRDISRSICDSDDLTTAILGNTPFVIPITDGTFKINGNDIEVQRSFSLFKIFESVTLSTGIACTYDSASDQIILQGESQIYLGDPDDTSNFLVACRLQENGRNRVCSRGRITGSVFEPLDVPLFRLPSTRNENGTILMRACVLKTGSNEPLGGVLIKVYRSPRNPADKQIGYGLTEWRGPACGEALVMIRGIPRFRPGEGDRVVEKEQLVEFETVRSIGFTADRFPDGHALLYGCGDDLVVAPSVSDDIEPPAQPMSVEAGREYSITLKMP